MDYYGDTHEELPHPTVWPLRVGYIYLARNLRVYEVIDYAERDPEPRPCVAEYPYRVRACRFNPPYTPLTNVPDQWLAADGKWFGPTQRTKPEPHQWLPDADVDLTDELGPRSRYPLPPQEPRL